jgi:hypothetical protein
MHAHTQPHHGNVFHTLLEVFHTFLEVFTRPTRSQIEGRGR